MPPSAIRSGGMPGVSPTGTGCYILGIANYVGAMAVALIALEAR
jgi:hypothetical protein